MENKYRIFSVLIITITCVAAGLFYFSLAGKVGTIYVDNTEKAINEIKQTFLKHTVDNQILRIRERREEEVSRMSALVHETERKLHFIAENDPGQLFRFLKKPLMTRSGLQCSGMADLEKSSMIRGGSWTSVLLHPLVTRAENMPRTA